MLVLFETPAGYALFKVGSICSAVLLPTRKTCGHGWSNHCLRSCSHEHHTPFGGSRDTGRMAVGTRLETTFDPCNRTHWEESPWLWTHRCASALWQDVEGVVACPSLDNQCFFFAGIHHHTSTSMLSPPTYSKLFVPRPDYLSPCPASPTEYCWRRGGPLCCVAAFTTDMRGSTFVTCSPVCVLVCEDTTAASRLALIFPPHQRGAIPSATHQQHQHARRTLAEYQRTGRRSHHCVAFQQPPPSSFVLSAPLPLLIAPPFPLYRPSSGFPDDE